MRVPCFAAWALGHRSTRSLGLRQCRAISSENRARSKACSLVTIWRFFMRTAMTRNLTAIAGALLCWSSLAVQAQPQRHLASPPPPPPHAAPHHPAPPPPAAQQHHPAAPGHAKPPPPRSGIGQMPPPPQPPHARPGAGHDGRWGVGDRVPSQWRTQHYVVHDWRVRGLKRPLTGTHWIQHGNQYLLVSTSSGKVSQVVRAR